VETREHGCRGKSHTNFSKIGSGIASAWHGKDPHPNRIKMGRAGGQKHMNAKDTHLTG
jgi:hypothetical protein